MFILNPVGVWPWLRVHWWCYHFIGRASGQASGRIQGYECARSSRKGEAQKCEGCTSQDGYRKCPGLCRMPGSKLHRIWLLTSTKPEIYHGAKIFVSQAKSTWLKTSNCLAKSWSFPCRSRRQGHVKWNFPSSKLVWNADIRSTLGSISSTAGVLLSLLVAIHKYIHVGRKNNRKPRLSHRRTKTRGWDDGTCKLQITSI